MPLLQTMRTSMYGDGEKKRYETVRVYYGTDRATQNKQFLPAYYGSQRAQDGRIQYGYLRRGDPYDRRLAAYISILVAKVSSIGRVPSTGWTLLI